jgi:hypothetical protein
VYSVVKKKKGGFTINILKFLSEGDTGMKVLKGYVALGYEGSERVCRIRLSRF